MRQERIILGKRGCECSKKPLRGLSTSLSQLQWVETPAYYVLSFGCGKERSKMETASRFPPLRLPLVFQAAVDAVFAVFALFLFSAFFSFFAFFTAIAHVCAPILIVRTHWADAAPKAEKSKNPTTSTCRYIPNSVATGASGSGGLAVRGR